MLGKLELAERLKALGTPDAGVGLIDAIRSGQSAFNPMDRQGTRTVVAITSAKMKRRIIVQSRTLRASAVMWYEFQNEIMEYYAYPHAFDAITRRDDGRIVGKSHHWFDFLILGDGVPRFEDWKEEAVLFQSQRKEDERWLKVGRYVRDEKGRWHDKVCEDYCASIGLEHRVRTNREIPRRFLDNISYLRDFFEPSAPNIESDTAERLQQCVAEGPISFDQMMKREGFEADVLLAAIVQGVLYADLDRESLGNPADLLMHRDAVLAEADRLIRRGAQLNEPLPIPGLGYCPIGSRLRYGGEDWTVILGSEGSNAKRLLTTETGKSMELEVETVQQLMGENATQEERIALLSQEKRRTLGSLSEAALKKAIRKYKAVVEGEGADQFPDSTLRRFQSTIRDCTNAADALVKLATRDSDKGNRQGRLAPRVEELAEKAIKEIYNAPSAGSATKAFDKYVIRCAEEGVAPMSYQTFCVRVRTHQNLLDRSGKRIAYRDGPIPLILDARESVDGVLPHDVCYIDHTEVNLFTKGPNGQGFGKPWLSAGIDGHIASARAMYLTYRPPSAMSVLMILRDYVRRWGRLPRIIVVDGGRDMRSRVFAQFCEIHNIDVRYRSGGRPRGGKDIERMFGVSEEELLSGLEGSSMSLKEARTVTQSVDPTRRATWTFPQFYCALDRYLFDFRFRHHVHPALGMTPCEFEQSRLEKTGRREHMRVEFDENLLLLTAPSPSRSEHKIQAQRGVWESGMFYWHPDFAKLSGKKCPVRYEPWLANVIYVYTGDRWVTALARDLEPFWGRTRYEVEQARRDARNFARLAAERDRHTLGRARNLEQVRTPVVFSQLIAEAQKVEYDLYKRLGMANVRTVDFGVVRRQPAAFPADPEEMDGCESSKDVEAAVRDSDDVVAAETLTSTGTTARVWDEPDEETGFV